MKKMYNSILFISYPGIPEDIIKSVIHSDFIISMNYLKSEDVPKKFRWLGKSVISVLLKTDERYSYSYLSLVKTSIKVHLLQSYLDNKIIKKKEYVKLMRKPIMLLVRYDEETYLTQYLENKSNGTGIPLFDTKKFINLEKKSRKLNWD